MKKQKQETEYTSYKLAEALAQIIEDRVSNGSKTVSLDDIPRGQITALAHVSPMAYTRNFQRNKEDIGEIPDTLITASLSWYRLSFLASKTANPSCRNLCSLSHFSSKTAMLSRTAS